MRVVVQLSRILAWNRGRHGLRLGVVPRFAWSEWVWVWVYPLRLALESLYEVEKVPGTFLGFAWLFLEQGEQHFRASHVAFEGVIEQRLRDLCAVFAHRLRGSFAEALEGRAAQPFRFRF